MKKLFLLIFSLFFMSCAAFADGQFDVPLPDAKDEVTTSGPDTKFTLASQMRFDAFENAENQLAIDVPEERKVVPIYRLSQNEKYLEKIKIPNAKIIEYTNGTYDIKFKDTPNVIYNYDKTGNLNEVITQTNKAKVPFASYHYDVLGQIKAIEVKPDFYHSYVYDLEGVLQKYVIYDKVYLPNGKLVLKRKTNFFW
ncbi:MAG: hypothetical protein K6C94_01085 [Candidatus Gastranaerophilales bacterium]|nr:hypothetical protein [Candidatus Gastranaerophilales bacterium]